MLSKPVTLDLAQYFRFANIVNGSMDERTLSGVLPASAMKQRWKWQTEDAKDDGYRAHITVQQQKGSTTSSPTEITLQPIEIKTYFVSLAPRG